MTTSLACFLTALVVSSSSSLILEFLAPGLKTTRPKFLPEPIDLEEMGIPPAAIIPAKLFTSSAAPIPSVSMANLNSLNSCSKLFPNGEIALSNSITDFFILSTASAARAASAFNSS